MNPNAQTKITVVTHLADFDGLFCRAIAEKFLPGAEQIGWDWGNPLIKFPDEGLVYVMDLSPDCFEAPDKTMDETRVIWIDHHKSAIDKWTRRIPGYRIDGVAACRLAWQWFFVNQHNAQNATNEVMQIPLPAKQDYIDRVVSEPYAVQLAGEYDIWDKRNPDAEVFQFGLCSQELGDYEWAALLNNSVHQSLAGTGMDATESELMARPLLETGRKLQRYQQSSDKGMMSRSFIVELEGFKFLALTTARCNSLTFASKDVPETGHDALMGFYFNGDKWTVSLYHAKHNTGIDLSKIAVMFGGGGHRGACGFSAETLPFIP